MIDDQKLDDLEAIAQGKTEWDRFIHPTDTLLLIEEIRRLREEIRQRDSEAHAKRTWER